VSFDHDALAAEVFGTGHGNDDDGPSMNGAAPKLTLAADWLAGEPMDPTRTPGEPMAPLPGTPLPPGMAVLVSGPTGGGRSMFAEVLHYDSARAGVSSAYLGAEITRDEYDARAAEIASCRGDALTPELREALQRARYLDLPETISHAWVDPDAWVAAIVARYRWLTLDPFSHVASALALDFESNTDYEKFHDRLIGPLIRAGVTVLSADNIGHADDAKTRAKGASAKQDRADLHLSCARSTNPPGLAITAKKVRSVRAGITRGDEWLFARDTLRLVPRERDTTDTPNTFRPTAVMAKVSAAIERNPGLSKRAIRETVGGKSATVLLALELLISEGYVRPEAEQDGRKTQRHYPANPYTEPTAPQPLPNRSPDTVLPTAPRGPHSVGGGTVAVADNNGHHNHDRSPQLTDALTHSEGPESRKP
jgi:hypothetical protein